MTRVAREAYVLICGKYPTPDDRAGGMSMTITLTVMNEMYLASQFFDTRRSWPRSGTT
jgi:hydrogenase large subunit